MRITNEQKKGLADICRNLNLNIEDFETSGGYGDFNIKYKYDYFFFRLQMKKLNSYYITVKPVNSTEAFSIGGEWKSVLSNFTKWATGVSEELNTPTGWESFDTERYLHAEYADLNEPFTEVEKYQVKESIKELRERIKQLQIPEEQLHVISNKLDSLSQAVDNQNKFDWKSLFGGTIMSIITSFAMPPETAGMLWEYIKISFFGLRLKG